MPSATLNPHMSVENFMRLSAEDKRALLAYIAKLPYDVKERAARPART
jgi:hypothetical protein